MNFINPMNTNGDAPLDAQLATALESKPSVRIPADFAATVAARAAALPASRPRRNFSYGTAATFAAAVLLLLAMFALAPSSRPAFSSFAFDGELLASAQLIAIACWLAARRSV